MKQTGAILRNKWHEACLIISLWVAGCAILHTPFLPNPIMALGGDVLFFSLLGIPVSLLGLVLAAGFMRLVFLQGEARQPITALWKTGTSFFWRMAGFYLMLDLTRMIVFGVFWMSPAALGPHIHDARTASAIKHAAPIVASLLSIMLVAKPALFMPALIVTRDCSIRGAWRAMRAFGLLQTPLLPLLFIAQTLIIDAQWFLRGTVLKFSFATLLASRFVCEFLWIVIFLQAMAVVSPSSTRNPRPSLPP